MNKAKPLTRRELVLEALKGPNGLGGWWVTGPELANAEIGGSEGLRRLRELRADGWPIEDRAHPDSTRDVRQYRLRPTSEAAWPGDQLRRIVHRERTPTEAAADVGNPVILGVDPGVPGGDRTIWFCPKCETEGGRTVLSDPHELLGGFTLGKCATHGRITARKRTAAAR